MSFFFSCFVRLVWMSFVGCTYTGMFDLGSRLPPPFSSLDLTNVKRNLVFSNHFVSSLKDRKGLESVVQERLLEILHFFPSHLPKEEGRTQKAETREQRI